MPQLTYRLSELSAREIQAGIAIAIAVGALYCFLGYRLLRFIIGLTGFILAGSFTAVLVGLITHGNVVFMMLAGIAGGIAGAVALFFLYKTGIFLLGLLAGALVAGVLLAGMSDEWVSSAVVGAAVFGGLSALLFERLIATLATSIIGAWMAVHGIAIFVLAEGNPDVLRESLEDDHTRKILLAFWLAVSAAGAATQYAIHKRYAHAGKH